MKSIFFLSLLFTSTAFAQSPVRDPRIPFEQYIEEANGHSDEKSFAAATALRVAIKYQNGKFPDATEWESIDVMQSNFENLRDDRFLGDDFKRRIPWLYSDDGCYARAALMNSWYAKKQIPSPSKVFAFGKLSAYSETLNHKVYWWYHVAPVVQVKGEKYVLDPSVDPTKPLKLEDWLDAIGDPKQVTVSICKPGTYQPGDLCADDTIGVPTQYTTNELLDDEWSLVKSSGLVPEKVLGDEPPWK